MSNEIYGFADLPDRPDLPVALNALRKLTPLGVFNVSENDLVEFPSELRPNTNSLERISKPVFVHFTQSETAGISPSLSTLPMRF